MSSPYGLLSAAARRPPPTSGRGATPPQRCAQRLARPAAEHRARADRGRAAAPCVTEPRRPPQAVGELQSLRRRRAPSSRWSGAVCGARPAPPALKLAGAAARDRAGARGGAAEARHKIAPEVSHAHPAVAPRTQAADRGPTRSCARRRHRRARARCGGRRAPPPGAPPSRPARARPRTRRSSRRRCSPRSAPTSRRRKRPPRLRRAAARARRAARRGGGRRRGPTTPTPRGDGAPAPSRPRRSQRARGAERQGGRQGGGARFLLNLVRARRSRFRASPLSSEIPFGSRAGARARPFHHRGLQRDEARRVSERGSEEAGAW